MISRATLLLPCALVACATPPLPAPQLGPHTSHDVWIEANGPRPPPVQTETIGPPPSPSDVWIDGFWGWQKHRWVWVAGHWQRPPQDAYYALPLVIRIPKEVARAGGGTTTVIEQMTLPGHWHRRDGTVLGEVSSSKESGLRGEGNQPGK